MNFKRTLTHQNLLIGLASIGLATLLTTCSMETINSDELKTKRVWHSYTVTYDESNSTLTAHAELKFGGPTGDYINLVSPAKILFGKSPDANSPGSANTMAANQYVGRVGRYYEYAKKDKKTFDNQTQIDRRFSYTDSEGNILTTDVRIKKLIIKAIPASIDSTKSFSVGYEILAPVNSNDEVTLEITQSTPDKPTIELVRSISGKRTGTLTIPAAEIVRLEKRGATVSVFLVSHQNSKQKNGRMFSIQGKYYTPSVIKISQ